MLTQVFFCADTRTHTQTLDRKTVNENANYSAKQEDSRRNLAFLCDLAASYILR